MRLHSLGLAGLVAACLSLPSCGLRTANPYTAVDQSKRDPERAQQLNAEAAKILNSDPSKAEKLLRQALTADLYHGPAHNNLGVLYLKQGNLYDAASEFEWAKKLMPGHPDPRMNLAIALERAGRTDDALATYTTALEVYPDHLPTIEAMAMLQVRAGKISDQTKKLLDEIACRGETERWRAWARLQQIRNTYDSP